MTNETSYREKGRAVVLAALMVMSVFAMSAAFAGGAAADSHYDEGLTFTQADNLDDAEPIFLGQEITLEDFDSDATLHEGFDGDGETIKTIFEEGGDVSFDTDDLETDQAYTLKAQGTTDYEEEQTFRLVEENLDIEFASNSVAEDGSVDLEFESERDGTEHDGNAQNVNVSAEGLSASDLAAIFNAEDIDVDIVEHEDDDVVTLEDLSDDETIEATFSDVELGEHVFEFNVTDSLASETAEIEVTDDDADWNFGDIEGVNEGEIAEIDIEVEHSDEAVVVLSDDTDAFWSTVELENIEDEEITLQYNTHSVEGEVAGFDDGWAVHEDSEDNVSIADADTSGIEDEANSLPAYNWDLSIGDALESGEDYELQIESDVAALMINEGEVDATSQTHTAPEEQDLGDFDDFEDADVTATDTFADEDHMIVTVDDYGVEGQVAEFIDEHGTDNVGEELHDYLGIHLAIAEPASGPFGGGDSIESNETGDMTVDLLNEDLDTYDGDLVLVLETDELNVDQSYEGVFTISEANDFIESEDDEIEQEFELELVDREFEFDALDSLPADEDATATGTTTVAPGTTFSGQASSPGAEGGFVTTGDGVVVEGDDYNIVEVEYDLEGEEPGVLFSIDASQETASETEIEDELEDLTLGEPGEEPTEKDLDVSVDAPDQIDVGDDAEVDITVTNNKDSSVAGDLTFEIDGNEWTEEFDIDADDSVTESFTVEDLDEGDYDWTATASSDDAEDDEATGTLTVAEESENGDENGDDDDDDDDDDGTPGFGVAVAVVALLAAAMLALRRQN